jgi:hypothetical protein
LPDLRCITVISLAKRFTRRMVSAKRMVRDRCWMRKTSLRRRLSTANSLISFKRQEIIKTRLRQ